MRIRYYEKSAPLFMSNYKELRQFHSDEQLAIELKPTARILTLGLILTVLTGLTIILLPLTVIIGAIVLYVYLAEVRTKHYLVTSRRIILFQKSFWSDMGNRRDTYFDEIKDFTVIQSFRGKLFGYGGIKPVTIIAPPTARGMKEMKMARTRVERLEIMGGIRDPYRVRSQIQGVFRRVPERSNV